MHYWAQSWRLNPWDFRVVSATRERYGDQRIPAGSTAEDWPFDYAELEPYYDQVEYTVGISGQAGNVRGRINSAGNIFEGARQREYPMRPLRASPFTDLMGEAARQTGLNRSRVRRQSPLSSMMAGRPVSTTVLHSGGCHVQAKSSTAFTTIPKAVETGNLDVVTFCPGDQHRHR